MGDSERPIQAAKNSAGQKLGAPHPICQENHESLSWGAIRRTVRFSYIVRCAPSFCGSIRGRQSHVWLLHRSLSAPTKEGVIRS